MLLRDIFEQLCDDLGKGVHQVKWFLTPYHSLAMSSDALDRVCISQSFEFAAAHRLHVDSLDEQANRAAFGKCNNPSGHGHNYRLEVSVAVPVNEQPPRFTLRTLEDLVARRIIDAFDHKHLNRDTAEFANLNPSVENIARVCHKRLAEAVALAGGSLQKVTVWETEKTACTFPA
jgi:6-pyruvoyltetrahydropterin/6-carboxytetrahydropterin synthase